MKLFLARIVLGAVAFASIETYASGQDTDLYLGNPVGSFEDPVNWSNGVPNANEFALVAPGGVFTSATTIGTPGATTITITESQNEAAAGLDIFSSFDEDNNDFSQPGTLNFVITGGSTLTLGQVDPDGLSVTNQSTLNFSGGTINDVGGGVLIGENPGTDFTGLGAFNITSGVLNVTGGEIDIGFGGASTGTFTQSGSSTVTAQLGLFVGESILDEVGNSVGTYSLNGGTLTIDASSFFGDGVNATGTLNQTAGTLTATTSTLVFGNDGGTGAYNFSGGTANLDNLTLGTGGAGIGTVTQTGGNMTVSGDAVVGDTGTGTYDLKSGTAVFNGNLTVGNQAGASGVITQTGGTLTVNNDPAVIGESGAGTLNISGGTADFADGLTVGANAGSTGLVNQSGNSTVIVGATHALNLAVANSIYNLNGGTLEVGLLSGLGSLNFGSLGGTLLATGTTLADGLSGTIAKTAVVDAPLAGTAVTFSGVLSGANGALVLEGSNSSTFTFAAQQLYGGGTSIENGTLNTSLAFLPRSGPIFINTNGELNLMGTTTTFTPIDSSISGSGTLNINGNDIELTAPINFAGTTNTGGGNLRVFSGSLGNVSGAGNLILGGDPVVATGGTLALTGTNTYTGTTTINNGFTLLAHGLASSVVTNTGSLGFNTPLSNTPFVIAGMLNQPAIPGTGNLIVRTNGSIADLYTPSTATLYGTVTVHGAGTRTTADPYVIVATAPGGLTTGVPLANGGNGSGAGSLVAVTNEALFTAQLFQNGNTLELTTNQSFLSPFAQTPNQLAVARSIDTIIQDPSAGVAPFIASVNTLTANQVAEGLDELTPRPYLYMRDIAFENSTFLAQTVDGFLGDLRNGFTGLDTTGLSMVNPGMQTGLGRSLDSLLAFNNEGVAPNGVNYYPDDGESNPSPMMNVAPGGGQVISDSSDSTLAPTTAPPPSTSIFDGSGKGFNEFVSGDVILADLNQDNSDNEPKAHYTAGDVTGGVSFRMSSNLAAGVLMSYNHTDARTDSEGSHLRVDSYSPGLFATFFEKGFYANGLFSFGYNNYSDNRNINFADATAHSSPSGQQYVGNLDFGYDFHPDRHWTIGPTLGVEYTHLDVDSFTENGAGPGDLRVDSQNADSLRTRIGGRVVYVARAGSFVFQPHLSLQYQHEFLNNPFDLDSQLDIPGTPAFLTQGSNPGRDSGLLGFGLNATLNDSMTFFLDYLAEVGGSDYFVQSIQGGLKSSF